MTVFCSEQELQKLGSSFINLNSLPSGVTTLVAASANTKGLIIRSMFLVPHQANASLFASATAPSSYDDTTKRAIFFNWHADSDQSFFPYQVFVESGNGLFLAASTGGSARFCMTYDVLT